jgi:hypothetical protein
MLNLLYNLLMSIVIYGTILLTTSAISAIKIYVKGMAKVNIIKPKIIVLNIIYSPSLIL